MKAIFYTTTGPYRAVNQDGLSINGESFIDTREPESRYSKSKPNLLAAVDGMGGMGGGEEATSVILHELPSLLSEDLVSCAGLETGLLRIQKSLHIQAHHYPAMGAALAGIWAGAMQNIVFNCGDCRVYRYRSGYLEKLTHDHSVVQELFDSGIITEEEMRTHPRKNIVTSALSADDADPRIFCTPLLIDSGDRFLICSDGLWECLSAEEIEKCMGNEPELAAMLLQREIWRLKAHDNVSFIIASNL